MQDNINIESILRQAYNSIVVEGKSLRTVSEEIGMDRKKIKKIMVEILSQDELEQFNNAVSRRNNKLKEGQRNKKAKALETDSYKMVIESLANRGIQPEWIEEIYERCQEKNQTKISRYTLATKLVELLEYFEGRNEGILEESAAYISNEDVIQMILKNPRMINSDVQQNIIQKCSIITIKNDNNVGLANMKIKSNPGIFRKTIKDISDGR